jgi:hypothetical protein
MDDKNNLKDAGSSSIGQPAAGEAGKSGGQMTEWFTSHISRRKLGKGLALGGALAMAGITVYKLLPPSPPEYDGAGEPVNGASGSGGSDSASGISTDSLDLQKKEGWNVGSPEETLSFNEEVSTDSRGKSPSSGDPNYYLDPNYLISVYQPGDPRWQPFFAPTLIQSLSQQSLSGNMKPVFNAEMRGAYYRAEALRNLISQSPNPGRTLIISELPGPQSVALGAAMAGAALLVPVFDNWPHPNGVVPSHETLGAMAYYAGEISEKRSKLKKNAPVVLLLDSNRLATYNNPETQFDNRYVAKLPPADQLKQRGVQQVIYLVESESQKEELDDINEDLVGWRKQGINVRMLRLSEFKPYSDPVQGAVISVMSTDGTTPAANDQRHYYYGGSLWASWWFFNHYGYGYPRQVVVYSEGRSVSVPRPGPGQRYNPPAYSPALRPTIFSSSRIGGASGVGKTRPSGFGRTSVRMSSDGRVIPPRLRSSGYSGGSRSSSYGGGGGRSGSYGRGGGYSGG